MRHALMCPFLIILACSNPATPEDAGADASTDAPLANQDGGADATFQQDSGTDSNDAAQASAMPLCTKIAVCDVSNDASCPELEPMVGDACTLTGGATCSYCNAGDTVAQGYACDAGQFSGPMTLNCGGM